VKDATGEGVISGSLDAGGGSELSDVPVWVAIGGHQNGQRGSMRANTSGALRRTCLVTAVVA
jgi:hypothetical protein